MNKTRDWQSLIARLVDRSDKHLLVWKMNGRLDGVYRVEIGDSRVIRVDIIREFWIPDGPPEYSLAVENHAQVIVDMVTTNPMPSSPLCVKMPELRKELESLWMKAHEIALGGDQIWEYLMGEFPDDSESDFDKFTESVSPP